MHWARILAYVTGMVDQELLARNEYLAAENRILKARLKWRLQLSNAETGSLGHAVTIIGRVFARLRTPSNQHSITSRHILRMTIKRSRSGCCPSRPRRSAAASCALAPNARTPSCGARVCRCAAQPRRRRAICRRSSLAPIRNRKKESPLARA
jgi:hypothetical protein